LLLRPPGCPRLPCRQWSGVQHRLYRLRRWGRGRTLDVWPPVPGTFRWGAAMLPGQPSGVVHPPRRRTNHRRRRRAGV